MKFEEFESIDVYPVGLLRDLQHFRRGVHSPHSVRRLRYNLCYPLRMAAKRDWRAVKNYFNGYIAEPYHISC